MSPKLHLQLTILLPPPLYATARVTGVSPVPAAVSVSPFECSSRPPSHTHSEQPCGLCLCICVLSVLVTGEVGMLQVQSPVTVFVLVAICCLSLSGLTSS